MKTFFDFYADAGNIAGDATDVFAGKVTAGKMPVWGDKLQGKYLVNSSISDFLITLHLGSISIDLSGLQSGDNVIEFLLFNKNGNSSLYFGTVNGGNIFKGTSDPFANDGIVKLTLQDTSGSPADNTVVAKMGTVLFIPAA